MNKASISAFNSEIEANTCEPTRGKSAQPLPDQFTHAAGSQARFLGRTNTLHPARLESMGIQSVVFDSCAGRPSQEDFYR